MPYISSFGSITEDIELVRDDTSNLIGVNNNIPSKFYAEFGMAAIDTTNVWTETIIGTATTSITNQDEKRLGTLQATANGAKASLGTTNKVFSKANGAITLTGRYKVVQAGTGYGTGMFGLCNTVTGNGYTDLMAFDVSGTGITIQTQKNTISTTNANVIVATTTNIYYNFKIVLNSDWTEVKYYIDDVLMATTTTNIPDDVILYLFIKVYRNNTGNVTSYIDKVGVK